MIWLRWSLFSASICASTLSFAQESSLVCKHNKLSPQRQAAPLAAGEAAATTLSMKIKGPISNDNACSLKKDSLQNQAAAIQGACDQQPKDNKLSDDFVKGYLNLKEKNADLYAAKNAGTKLTLAKNKIEKYQQQINKLQNQLKDKDYDKKKLDFDNFMHTENEKIKSLDYQIMASSDSKEIGDLKSQEENIYNAIHNYKTGKGDYSLSKQQTLDKIDDDKLYLEATQESLEKLKKEANEQNAALKDASKDMEKARAYVAKEIGSEIEYLKDRKTFTECGLTDAEIYAINFYANDGYRDLNLALRDQNPPEIQKFQFLIDAMKSGMAKLKNYKGLVKRGSDLDNKSLAEYCDGCVVTMKAFTSTSTGAGFGAQYHFDIMSKHGVYIAPLSGMANEEEVLFAPGAKFKVLEHKGNDFTLQEVD